MSENYKPGTVAVATVCDIPGVRVFRRYNETGGDWAFNPEPERGIYYSCASDREGLVTDVRPLVVLDLDGGRVHAENVALYLREGGFPAIADQIVAQVQPSKPTEPRGIGAVIEDAEGDLWVHRGRRYDRAWSHAGSEKEYGGTARYADIAAVRVLSEGVEVDR